jgi:hypothetical protein
MDNRADIKIWFEAYGKKLTRELSINYWPEDEGTTGHHTTG